jgi:hypothetical protein
MFSKVMDVPMRNLAMKPVWFLKGIASAQSAASRSMTVDYAILWIARPSKTKLCHVVNCAKVKCRVLSGLGTSRGEVFPLRKFIVCLAVLLPYSVLAGEVDLSDLEQGFAEMFPASPDACPEGVPEDCICATLESKTELPMRYSRVQSCPHPVIEGVRNFKSFTADGAIVDDSMRKNGQLHGAYIGWHPNGKVEAIANFEQGRQIGFARVWHDNGTLAAEQQFVDGQSHGPELRYSRNGELDWIIVWDHGDVNREESRRLNQAHGLEAPFDRARPAAGQDDKATSE